VRGSGINCDIRRDMPYDAYSKLTFNVPLGTVGDCYDRYIVRMQEMRQSLSLM